MDSSRFSTGVVLLLGRFSTASSGVRFLVWSWGGGVRTSVWSENLVFSKKNKKNINNNNNYQRIELKADPKDIKMVKKQEWTFKKKKKNNLKKYYFWLLQTLDKPACAFERHCCWNRSCWAPRPPGQPASSLRDCWGGVKLESKMENIWSKQAQNQLCWLVTHKGW